MYLKRGEKKLSITDPNVPLLEKQKKITCEIMTI